MIILGVDPGTATTGYGILEKNGGNLLCKAFGCILTKPDTPSSRLNKIRTELSVVIKKYRPHVLSIEKLFFTTNAKTAISVAQARGVILECAASMGLEVREFTPLEVKRAATGYGKADKGQVQRMVKLLLNLKEIPKPDDAADALAVALCAANTNFINN